MYDGQKLESVKNTWHTLLNDTLLNEYPGIQGLF